MKAEELSSLPILAVDDEPNVLIGFELTMKMHGINNILCCTDSRKVMNLISENKFGLVLLDLTMPYISGLDLLKSISCEYPEIPVIIITGTNEVETAVHAIKGRRFRLYGQTCRGKPPHFRNKKRHRT